MRIRTIGVDDMTTSQRAAYDEVVAGVRGRMPAPMRAWIHSPEMASRAQRLGELLRYQTSLPPRLSELAILVTARHWTAHYEWFAHRKEAEKAGLESAIIAAIAERRDPPFADEPARLVYDYSKALHETHGVAQPLHDAAVGLLGEQGVVDLVGILGYYTLVAMTLNAFDIGLPAGERPEL